MTAAYHIMLVQPPGWVHVEAFREVAETLQHGLAKLGKKTSIAINQVEQDATNIVFGAYNLKPPHFDQIPSGAVLYNLEQLEDNPLLNPVYFDLLRRFRVWDYSRRNLATLAAQDCRNAQYVPLGYVKELTRIAPAPDQDIDVLFYGSINERREKILKDLIFSGLKVEVRFGTYGRERDMLIARAKVVLNLHFYPAAIFEVARGSYLFANRKAVVAEAGGDTEIDPDLRDAAEFVPYKKLVKACRRLVVNLERRRELEERGFQRFSARDEVAILREALKELDVAA